MRPVVESTTSSSTDGTTIGPYKVLGASETLGFGQAFKVFNTVVGRLEIMRVIPGGIATEELSARRFLNEAEILRRLEHPNIVKSYDAVEIDGDLILTMEFNEGTSLDQLMAERAVSLPDGLRYVSDVLAGLGCVHRAKIVHRCIAPSTIRILTDGSAKVDGFTFARVADDPRLTARGFAIGFVRYMSPEQAEGCRELDARSDLYSLAVVLYELITGKRPFQSKNQFQLMQAHLKEPVAPPSSIRSEIPPELDSLVLKALSKDPDRRFQAADEFLGVLNEVRNSKSS